MHSDHSAASRIRATDANRAAVSGALDAALESGQLDRFEHYERVRTAAQATWVGDLRPLLADLQGAGVELPGDRTRKREPARSSSSSSDPDTRSPTRTGLLLGLPIVVIAVAAVVAVALLADRDDPAPSSPPAVAIEQVDQAGDEAGDAARVLDNPGPLTLDGLQRIFSTAAAASGSEVATRITAHPEHAGMEWVDPEHPSRSWSSSYRGGWDEPDDRPSSRDESFRLADLDAEMIAAVIAGAPATLGVPDGTPSHIIIEADASGMPAYSVYASNDVHQSGYLTVNHAGEPVRMYPAN